MNYNITLEWLFQLLPMYQNQGKSAYKKDLSNIKKLAKHLDNPENKFKTIHVGGTNGKGSVSHMLASVLQEAGYKVGLYTSPHLKDFRERIRINGITIDKTFVTAFVTAHKSFFESHCLSFFEMTVGLAYQYFAYHKVDIAIIEVGLGGRLDSTNIITPELSIITNIGYDHTEILGNTLADIATEKSGIIKPNTPIVIGETQSETSAIYKHKAKAEQSEIFFSDTITTTIPESDLKGYYQKYNIKTVVKVVAVLNSKRKLSISTRQMKKGLLNVVKNTGLLGRWQILNQSPKIICDTAHNTEALTLTMAQLLEEDFRQLHIVFGVVSDKNMSSILTVLPKTAMYYLATPKIQRGMNVGVLAELFLQFNLNHKAYNSVEEAFRASKQNASINDVIYVGGSTFVVAEVL